jgi:hypothetical protein
VVLLTGDAEADAVRLRVGEPDVDCCCGGGEEGEEGGGGGGEMHGRGGVGSELVLEDGEGCTVVVRWEDEVEIMSALYLYLGG